MNVLFNKKGMVDEIVFFLNFYCFLLLDIISLIYIIFFYLDADFVQMKENTESIEVDIGGRQDRVLVNRI